MFYFSGKEIRKLHETLFNTVLKLKILEEKQSTFYYVYNFLNDFILFYFALFCFVLISPDATRQ